MTESGVTALMLAVKLNNKDCVAALLEAEANPFLKDQMGKTAQDYNIAIKHIDKSA